MQNVISILFLTLVASVSIYAQESKITTSVALVGMSMDYREYSNSNGEILDSEESNIVDLGGFDLGISFLMFKSAKASTRLEANVVLLGGETIYIGSLRNPPGQKYGSFVSTTANYIVDYQISLKQNHILNDKLNMYYSIGIGHRSWERALSAAQIEIYEWYSLRVKGGLDFRLSKKFKVGAELEYQDSFNETMSASDLGVTFDLGGANIFKVSVPLVYRYTNTMDIVFKAVYEKQEIIESNSITVGANTYYEPRSTANNQYLQIGLDFKF